MIKIDEVFSIKNYGPGWELHEIKQKRDQTGMVTTVSYHSSLRLGLPVQSLKRVVTVALMPLL